MKILEKLESKFRDQYRFKLERKNSPYFHAAVEFPNIEFSKKLSNQSNLTLYSLSLYYAETYEFAGPSI